NSRGGQPALVQPVPKRDLPMTMLIIAEQLLRALHALAKQEHQPGYTSFAGSLELQLRVGQFRLVPDRGTVAEPNDGHIDISSLYRLAAHQRGREVPRGEVRHITDSVPSPGHRTLPRSYKRPTPGTPPQLRCVTQKHTPWPHHDAHHPSHHNHKISDHVISDHVLDPAHHRGPQMIIIGRSPAQGAQEYGHRVSADL